MASVATPQAERLPLFSRDALDRFLRLCLSWMSVRIPILQQRWRDYWFAPGFSLSHAVCRVGLAICYWRTAVDGGLFAVNWEYILSTYNPEVYRPIGILTLLGAQVPSATFLAGCQLVAQITMGLVLVGCCTRVSVVICTLAMWVLASVHWSFSDAWSHNYNVVLLAGIAYMFGPTSPWSLDALVKWGWQRWTGRPIVPERSFRWPILLAQAAVALMFFNAAFWKLFHLDKPFASWIWSDNMRNLLIYQYWMRGEPMPEFLQYVVEHAWAYKCMALANIIAQLLPLAACLLVRRPLLRALAGLAFVVEIFALAEVMKISNPHWALLYVFFVDWDALGNWLRRRIPGMPKTGKPEAPVRASASFRSRQQPALPWANRWILGFLAIYLFVAFLHTQQRRITYPFSAFPMYCVIFAAPPYAEHHPWMLPGTHFDFDVDQPLDRAAQQWIRRNHLTLGWVNAPAAAATLEQTKTMFARIFDRKIDGAVVRKASFEIQPYPSSEVVPKQSAVSLIWREGKAIGLDIKIVGTRRGPYFVFSPHGLEDPTYEVGYFPNMTGDWTPIDVRRDGVRYYFQHNLCAQFPAIWVRDRTLGSEPVLMTCGSLAYECRPDD